MKTFALVSALVLAASGSAFAQSGDLGQSPRIVEGVVRVTDAPIASYSGTRSAGPSEVEPGQSPRTVEGVTRQNNNAPIVRSGSHGVTASTGFHPADATDRGTSGN